MVAVKAIVVIAMFLMFVDAVFQYLTGGGILLQGDRYTFIELIILFFQLIIGFAALIIHAITHISDLTAVTGDLELFLSGLFSLLNFVVGSVIELLLHLISLPFEYIGAGVIAGGGAFAIYIDLWAFGFILIDFRTITFMVQIGNIDTSIFGTVDIVIQNKIGFSLLGASSTTVTCYVLSVTNLLNLGIPQVKTDIFPSYLVDKFISLFVELDDFVSGQVCISIYVPLIDVWLEACTPELTVGVENLGLNVSLDSLFEDILTEFGVPTLAQWVNTVWVRLGLETEPTVSSNMQYLLYQMQQVIYHVKKR